MFAAMRKEFPKEIGVEDLTLTFGQQEIEGEMTLEKAGAAGGGVLNVRINTVTGASRRRAALGEMFRLIPC